MSVSVVPLKRLAGINERALPDNTDPDRPLRYIDISSVGRGELITDPQPMRFADAPSRARRLVRPGDTIVSTVRTYLRAIWPVSGPTDDLVVSTGFAALTPRSVDPRYFSWWVQSDLFIEEVVARSVGVSYPAINALELGELPVRVPVMGQQRAIADFLDTETARIDALIAKKRHMIEMLAERAAAAIDAVLGFHLDWSRASVPRPIPNGFPVVRLGLVAVVQTGLTLDSAREVDSSVEPRPYLRVANVQDGHIDLTDVKDVRVPLALAARCTLRAGDVLMTEGGDPDKLGRGTVWRGQLPDCLHQNHVFAVRPMQQLRPEFLALVTRSSYARAYFELTASKTTGIASTSTTKIASFRIPLPPLDEQARTVARADIVLGHIARSTSVLQRQIDLLQEHRQALITAAVTGELEVSGVAA